VLTGVLVIEFDGDCWLKVSDGSGRVLAAALKRAGQRFETSEVGPFELVLGDARVVRLRYQGATYDLLPHTSRNGRAAFRLD
jgi:cytoskeleton protein RodZ